MTTKSPPPPKKRFRHWKKLCRHSHFFRAGTTKDQKHSTLGPKSKPLKILYTRVSIYGYNTGTTILWECYPKHQTQAEKKPVHKFLQFSHFIDSKFFTIFQLFAFFKTYQPKFCLPFFYKGCNSFCEFPPPELAPIDPRILVVVGVSKVAAALANDMIGVKPDVTGVSPVGILNVFMGS